MNRLFTSLVLALSLLTANAVAEEKAPPAPPPPAATAPPEPQKPVVSCELPSLALPPLFIKVITNEVQTIKANDALIRQHSIAVQYYAVKKADYQACLQRGSGCTQPGPEPKEPALTPTMAQKMKNDFTAKLGTWLICAEIRRTFAKETCLAGNNTQMSTLDADLKAACPFQTSFIRLPPPSR